MAGPCGAEFGLGDGNCCGLGCPGDWPGDGRWVVPGVGVVVGVGAVGVDVDPGLGVAVPDGPGDGVLTAPPGRSRHDDAPTYA
ncbi:hypothetical protein [Streptomyces sp. NPDC090025]|uniref:hypothetical protein n=1 Tax=Streptomyces sp. NPDC090025 TaxID=3365922 RepID=UPI003833F031